MGLCVASQEWDKHLHLRQTPLEGAMDYHDVQEISNSFTIHDFKSGDVIVEKGTTSDAVYAIVSGEASLILKEREGKSPISVTIGVNNFVGGYGLISDAKDRPIEYVSVLGSSEGKYVKLGIVQFEKLKQSNPKSYQIIRDLIALRHSALEIPFFQQVTKSWKQESRDIFASLFRYQAFTEYEELIAESGKQADRLIILIKGRLSISNMRKGDEVFHLSEAGKLLNLTSLFYNYGQNCWDITASPPSQSEFTQVLFLPRTDFKKFLNANVVDCYKQFEQASIEYLLREMRTQQRLFLHVVEEKYISEFCSLWKLKEYGENVKITMKQSFNVRNGSSSTTVTKTYFHIVVGGSADAYSNEKRVHNGKQMRKAHRRQFLYGCGIGILSNKLAALNSELSIFSGKTRCLLLTLEKDDFDKFFNKIGKHDVATELAEQDVASNYNGQNRSQTSHTPGFPSRLGESPSRSNKRECKFRYTHTSGNSGTQFSGQNSTQNNQPTLDSERDANK
mmetsp:Transcript_25029/g.34857  ORF Transcript_25029/g.34857 Transcript_25029/m.34857 type:complete len:506 (+) Transcript_25029:172-1689(+)